jgi:hypothetical protein
MDEFDENFTVDELISKEKIDIKTIYLLSENDKYIIALSWFEFGDAHFKMFKKLSLSDVKAFSNFLLEYDKNWYELVINWIAKPFIPLCLNTTRENK